MKHLVLIIPSLNIGGAERSSIKFANAMAASGWQTDIVVFSEKAGELSISLTQGIEVHPMGDLSTSNPLLWFKVRRQLLKLQPDVVIGWSIYANLVAVLVRMPWDNWRILVSERNYMPKMFERGNIGFFQRLFVLKLIKYFYARADVVTANSLKSLRFLRLYLGAGPLYLHLPNMIDVAEAKSMAKNTPTDIPKDMDGPHILALGRLVYQKGFDILIEAMAKVRKKRPWSLVIVGDGPLKNDLRLKAQGLNIADAIHWMGVRPNPYPYYGWADLVVVPSRFEGFPNVPLEAMACGCTVICTDCMTGPRELTMNGRYGYLVPANDPIALAESIIALGDDDQRRQRIGEEASSYIDSVHDVSVITPHLSSIIEQNLGSI